MSKTWNKFTRWCSPNGNDEWVLRDTIHGNHAGSLVQRVNADAIWENPDWQSVVEWGRDALNTNYLVTSRSLWLEALRECRDGQERRSLVLSLRELADTLRSLSEVYPCLDEYRLSSLEWDALCEEWNLVIGHVTMPDYWEDLTEDQQECVLADAFECIQEQQEYYWQYTQCCIREDAVESAIDDIARELGFVSVEGVA